MLLNDQHLGCCKGTKQTPNCEKVLSGYQDIGQVAQNTYWKWNFSAPRAPMTVSKIATVQQQQKRRLV